MNLQEEVPAHTQAIDRPLGGVWQAAGIKPSPRCDDHEFIRRVSLDLIGRIATPKEIDAFTRDQAANRRARFIERLLDSDEFSLYWGTRWADLLLGPVPEPEMMTIEGRDGVVRYLPMPSREPEDLRPRFRAWLAEQLRAGKGWDAIVTSVLTATGKHRDNPAVAFLLTHLGTPIAEGKRAEEGQHDMLPAARDTARLFLGMRLDAQPAFINRDRTTPARFWGLNCCFRQVERRVTGTGKDQVCELLDNPDLNPKNLVLWENTIEAVCVSRSQFLGRKFNPQFVPEQAKMTRREFLARIIVEHEQFAQVFVNRVWGWLFGRSLTEWDVDDFGEHNEPVQPEVFDRVCRQFRNDGYDVRKLVRLIVFSDAYQATSIANEWNDKERDELQFSRMLLKRLDGFQLATSLWVATHLLPDKDAKKEEAARQLFRERWQRQLEQEDLTRPLSLAQALLLMNDPTIENLIDKAIDEFWKVRPKNLDEMSDRLFVQALNRSTTARDRRQLLRDFTPVLVRNRNLDPTYWRAVSSDLLWALLNSCEFFVNH